ncbi:TetR/AcrR family transcriptional regulator [Nocardia brasiliensis]|uniref:TetR/AcrR family transcriptional regulator n=1 Tax=Nocardia brasiliensis TaxID=37326 RepID=UPI003D8CA7A3
MTGAPRTTYHHGDLRAALLEQAELTLRSSGVEQLSLREVSRAIGVSNAAPRRHFQSKDELLDALATVGFQKIGRAIRAVPLNRESPFRTRLADLMTAYLRFAEENSALVNLMFSRKLQNDRDTQLSATAAAAFEPSLELIRAGQQEGAVTKETEPERISVVLFATMHGLAAMAVHRMLDRDTIATATEDAVHFFLDGAAPRAPRRKRAASA